VPRKALPRGLQASHHRGYGQIYGGDGKIDGPSRKMYKEQVDKEVEELESSGASIEELEALGTGRLRAAVIDGDVEWVP